jgi:hypothetical protein
MLFVTKVLKRAQKPLKRLFFKKKLNWRVTVLKIGMHEKQKISQIQWYHEELRCQFNVYNVDEISKLYNICIFIWT